MITLAICWEAVAEVAAILGIAILIYVWVASSVLIMIDAERTIWRIIGWILHILFWITLFIVLYYNVANY